LSGDRFRYDLDGQRKSSPSLAAARKAIDKHLAAKAEEQSHDISLPVVVLYKPRFYCRDTAPAPFVRQEVISGLDPHGRILGLNPPDDMECTIVLPYSPENEAALRTLLLAEEALGRALKAVKDKRLLAYYGGKSSRGRPYGAMVQELLASYVTAVKGKSDD
jgi:hypothetical protein